MGGRECKCQWGADGWGEKGELKNDQVQMEKRETRKRIEVEGKECNSTASLLEGKIS